MAVLIEGPYEIYAYPAFRHTFWGMPRQKQSGSLFQHVWMTFGAAPRVTLILCRRRRLRFCCHDLTRWFTGTKQAIAMSIGVAIFVAVVVVDQYDLKTMAERQLSVLGIARYAATGVGRALPAALAFDTAWVLPGLVGKSLSGPIFVCLLLIGVAFIFLLPAGQSRTLRHRGSYRRGESSPRQAGSGSLSFCPPQ